MILYTLIGSLCHSCNLLDNGKVMWRNHCCNILFQSADGCVVWQIELIINKDPGFSKESRRVSVNIGKTWRSWIVRTGRIVQHSHSSPVGCGELRALPKATVFICVWPDPFHWEIISFLLLLLETACALELESPLARWEVRRAMDHSVSQSPCPLARWCPSSPVLLVGLWVLLFRNKVSGWKVT